MMFEIGVSAFILFAIGYWATLFIMGRREDVLHGQFVEADPELASAGAGASVAFPRRMAPPVKATPAMPAPVMSAPVEPIEQQAAARFEPPPTPEPETAPAPVTATSLDGDAWESLLASLKLKSASQT